MLYHQVSNFDLIEQFKIHLGLRKDLSTRLKDIKRRTFRTRCLMRARVRSRRDRRELIATFRINLLM